MDQAPAPPRKGAHQAHASVVHRASVANATVMAIAAARAGQVDRVVPLGPVVLVVQGADAPAEAAIRRGGRYARSVSTTSGMWITRTSRGSGDTLANEARSNLGGSLGRVPATSGH